MCGLSGVAGWVTTQEKDAVLDLLTMNITRGADSAGIGLVTTSDKEWAYLCKALGTPFGDGGENPGLFNLKSFEKIMSKGAKCIISHNRSATIGEISVRNAHPFKFAEGLIAAHNGTLRYGCKDKLPNGKEFMTDSEAVFNSFLVQGVEKTVSELEGAWAFTWYDHRDGTLNFLRNKERTLYYIFSEDKKVLVWSSDHYHLLYAINKNKIQIGNNKPMLLTEDNWLSWKLPSLAEKFPEPVRKKLQGKQTVIVHSGHTFKGHKQFNWGDDEASYYENVYGYQGAYSYTPPACGVFPKKDDTPVPDNDGEVSSPDPLKDDPSPFKTELERAAEEAEKIAQAAEKKNVIVTEYCPVAKSYVPKGMAKKLDDLNNVISLPISKKLYEANKKKFDEQYKALPKDWILRYEGINDRVYWAPSAGNWKWFRHDAANNRPWTLTHSSTPPSVMPFRLYDPSKGGHHAFKYDKIRQAGSKKRDRVISYKGFKGSLLVQQSFDKLMQNGCTNCQRIPKWGNIVKFFDHENFLCEYCETMPEVVKLVHAV